MKKWLPFLLIINLLALYAGHFDNEFQFDDAHTVKTNHYIRRLSNIPEFFVNPKTFSTLPSNQSYRPMLTTTYAIDYYLGGKVEPFFFHLSSFLFFMIQLIVMFLLFQRLLCLSFSKTETYYLSLFAVAWYAFHGAMPDTVSYISSRSDIFSTFAVVASLYLFTFSFCRKYLIYLLPAAFGLFSKEQAGVLPGILFVYYIIFETNFDLKKFFKKVHFSKLIKAFLLSLPSLVLALIVVFLGFKLSPSWDPGGRSKIAYLQTQPFVVLDYFSTFFLPIGLSADSDWGLIHSFKDIRVFLGLIFIIFSLYVMIRTYQHPKLRYLAFGLAWFFISLIPSSSIIPLAEVKNDHRLFFPYVGLTLASTVGLYLLISKLELKILSKQKSLAYALGALIVLTANSAIALERIAVWNTEESLWLDVTKRSPKNGRGLMNYGLSQMAKGKYQDAEGYFLRARELLPNYTTLEINLGILYRGTNRPELANKHFERALQLSPNNAKTKFFYATWLQHQGQYQEAIEHLFKSNQLAPGRIEVYHHLMDCYLALDRYQEAKSWARKALDLSPEDSRSIDVLERVANIRE